MYPWIDEHYGNPSSREYDLAWEAAEVIQDARLAVANQVGAQCNEITFTGSATEALNTAIKGFVGFADWHQKKIITSAAEHDAVLACCRQLHRAAAIEVDVLPVDRHGHIDLHSLRSSISSSKNTLIALMVANNEIGTLSPVSEIGDIARAAGATFLCDITQAIGKIPIDAPASGIDMAAFCAHKIYGPKGVGALFVRARDPRIELEPLIAGGEQEQGLRGGTSNVAGIVGFGQACRIAGQAMHDEVPRIAKLRDRLEQTILADVPDTWLNGDPANRIGNTTNIGFSGIDARTLIRDMHDIAVSTRSACSSGKSGPSHVLKAIGLTDEDAYSCIRFSLGRFTTEGEIEYTIKKVTTSVHKLRRSKGLVS
jgi:cysteine desulfurase